MYEDAETYPAWGESGLLEEGYLDDGALGVYSGLDPPLISDAASGSGTPVRGTSLAGNVVLGTSSHPDLLTESTLLAVHWLCPLLLGCRDGVWNLFCCFFG